ncbi:MAG: aminotransferase class IV [Candidatus ainarchaeum sp.]|nr:aminotransferase class IV [Candidatus ainarchaeum sp.]
MVEQPVKGEYVWFDGNIRPIDGIGIMLDTSSLHYGTTVFEGIQNYNSRIFRLGEHLDRLFHGASVLHMGSENIIFRPDGGFFTKEDITQAIEKTIVANGFTEGCYIRPIVFRGSGSMLGVNALGAPVQVAIITEIWPQYISNKPAVLSQFRRMDPRSGIAGVKAGGSYLFGTFAKDEAVEADGSEPLMLDTNGFLAEASGANIMVVLDGQICTPYNNTGILPGITRDTVMNFIAKDLGIKAREMNISLYDLISKATEAFWVGTAAEVAALMELFITIDVLQRYKESLGPKKAYQLETAIENGNGCFETRPNPVVGKKIEWYEGVLVGDPEKRDRLIKAGEDPEKTIAGLEKQKTVGGVRLQIGTKSPVTDRVAVAYRNMTRGHDEKYTNFLHRIRVGMAQENLGKSTGRMLNKNKA